jgi:hypothetical protein
VSSRVSIRTHASKFARAILPEWGDFRRRSGGASSCFLATGVTTRSLPNGVENWLIDGYARATGYGPEIFQYGPLGKGQEGRPLYAGTRSLSRVSTQAEMRTLLAPMSRGSAELVRSVVRSAAQKIDFPLDEVQVAKIMRDCILQISKARFFDVMILKSLMKTNASTVYMDLASYGSRSGLVSMLKARGVTVVEPQHGWIGASHGAYNFGTAMHNSPLNRTLPDFLLTFGDFWSENIRHPATSIAVGKPHLEDMAKAVPALRERPHEVLVVSSVAEPEAAAKLTLTLRDALPAKWTVVFRPHPSERATMRERYPALHHTPRIRIDPHADVFESLARARGVVGIASTVLYEALAMGPKVFVMESPFAAYYIDTVFGNLINGPGDIGRVVSELVAESDTATPLEVVEHIWKPNALTNFVAFDHQLSRAT